MAKVAARPLRIVVTAGPTREAIDDVRYLSNASTGRMGYEIAREAKRRGAAVTLILGPSSLSPLAGVKTVDVVTTRDLLTATRAAAKRADVIVFAAAPADWRPAVRVRGKIKKDGTGRPRTITLVENPDVAAILGKSKGRRFHLGFALEVTHGLEHAREKMARKRFDALVLNGPENVGRGGGRAWLLRAEPEALSARRAPTIPVALPTGDKTTTARAILNLLWDRFAKS